MEIVVEELIRNQENLLDGLVTAASTTSTGHHVEARSLIFEVKLAGSSIKMDRLNVDYRVVQVCRIDIINFNYINESGFRLVRAPVTHCCLLTQVMYTHLG